MGVGSIVDKKDYTYTKDKKDDKATEGLLLILGGVGSDCSNDKDVIDWLRQGHVIDIEVGKLALRNIYSLALFSNIEVNPRPDEKNEWGFIVEIKLNELEQYNAEVSTDWSIIPERQGHPTLPSIQPGGTIKIEHRNIQGLNRSSLGSITTINFIDPQFEYIQPYLDGVKDPRNRTFCSRCFNSGKLSLFPPIWVDRAGVKANITENFTRQSEINYGLVLEKIITQNESTNISQNDGPPITLSGTGVDKFGFFQSNITRDNTKLVNGAIAGLFVGSKFPFFNRHQLTYTKFLQLKPVEGVDKPPPSVLVLHGHYGGLLSAYFAYIYWVMGIATKNNEENEENKLYMNTGNGELIVHGDAAAGSKAVDDGKWQ
ncbi:hypothetical protein MKX03_026035 [Papaver bracteatum]|nr:hypothetical protein MKX03_026035 [Papaver bracteatum]